MYDLKHSLKNKSTDLLSWLPAAGKIINEKGLQGRTIKMNHDILFLRHSGCS